MGRFVPPKAGRAGHWSRTLHLAGAEGACPASRARRGGAPRPARRASRRIPPSAARARAAPPLTALPTQKTPYEWAGVFELQKGHKYSWIAQKTGGKYVDDSMELLYKELPATQAVTTENVQALNPADYADPAMKIVFITGFAAVALSSGSPTPAGAKVLSKPFHLREIVEEVDKVMAA